MIVDFLKYKDTREPAYTEFEFSCGECGSSTFRVITNSEIDYSFAVCSECENEVGNMAITVTNG
jgi:hypothetical protein